MSKFGNDVRAGIDEMKQDIENTLRAFYLELFTQIILRSPVGNPLNWKVNQRQAAAQSMAAQQNILRRASNSTSYVTKKGTRRLKKGKKATGNTVLRTRYGSIYSNAGPRKHITRRGGDMISKPKGYQGGGFRGAWQFSYDIPASMDIDRVDPSGKIATAALVAALDQFSLTGHPKVYFVNNKVYSEAIEFGVAGKSPLYPVWSRQAPQGVVRVTLKNAAVLWERLGVKHR